MPDAGNPIPLYAQVFESLRARLSAGEWRPGDVLPTEAELCSEYAVSRITVGRAMADLAREGFVRRWRRKGTVVLEAPAGPPLLAFVTPNLALERALDIYRSYAAAAAEHLAVLCSPAGYREVQSERDKRVLGTRARAVAIFWDLRPNPDEVLLLQDLRRWRVPFAYVGTYDPTVMADRVVADNYAAGRLAVRHLASLGHRRIAFLGPGGRWLAGNTAFRDRLRGYRAAMRAAFSGGPDVGRRTWLIEDALPAGLPEAAQGERLLGRLGRWRATAVVAATPTLGTQVQRLLAESRVRVPDDLAVVAIGDAQLTEQADPPITTVHIDAAGLGAEVARLLLQRLDGDRAPARAVVLPIELVVRTSCGARQPA